MSNSWVQVRKILLERKVIKEVTIQSKFYSKTSNISSDLEDKFVETSERRGKVFQMEERLQRVIRNNMTKDEMTMADKIVVRNIVRDYSTMVS